MTMEKYRVTKEKSGERLDKLLVKLVPTLSRQQIQTLIRDENVLINEQKKKPNYKCKINDVITWSIPEREQLDPIKAEDIPLNIVYEDDYLIVINKPKGMLVHPTDKVRTGTLVNGLLHYSEQLSDLGGLERKGIVHRLDQDTSGLLVVAKDNETHAHLKKQFKQRTVTRIYEALVIGNVSPSEGIIQAPIGRHPKNRLLMSVVSTGKEAE